METPAPFALLAEVSPAGRLSVAYTAYLSMLVAYVVWGDLLKRNDAVRVTPVALLIPVVGVGVAGVFLGERMTALEIAGGAAIIVGLCCCLLPFGAVVRWVRLRLTPSRPF